MKKVENVVYSKEKNLSLDILLPDRNEFDVVIWFHGGGLEAGSRKDIGGFAEDLVKNGFAVISPDYRLYPNAKFPDFLADAACAAKYVLDHVSNFGDKKRLFIGGSSAGAYLAAMLALDKRYYTEAGVNSRLIDGYICDSAQMTTHYNVLRERGIDIRLERIDEAAPLYHLNAGSDFGSLLLICYSEDIPCRQEQNRLFYAAARRLCPKNRVEIRDLLGRHCSGVGMKKPDGGYVINDVLLDFLKTR